MSSRSDTNDAAGRAPAGSSSVAPGQLPDDAGAHYRAIDFFTRARLAKIVILAIPFFWLFHGTLYRLFRVWWSIPDWSHGLLIPFFSLGIFLYIHDRWRNVRLKPTYAGLAVVALAMLTYVVAVWWLKLIMLQDYAWWMLLFGLVLTLCGWRFTWAAWFPLAFIGFGIRIGGVAYSSISAKLQVIAAHCSTLILKVVRIHAEIEGVIIDVFTRSGARYPMQVAEACSGMRILMAFAALGSLIAYVVRRPWWHRLILVLAILPIAVISNVLRVTGMGVLYYYDRKDLATGLAHTLEGMLMLPVAFALFWLLHVLLCKLVIEEPADGATEAIPPPPKPAAAPVMSWGQVARELREPHFVTLALVLFGLALASTFATFHPNKQPVPLRLPLDAFPRTVAGANGATWVATSPIPSKTQPDEGFGEVINDLDVERFLGATHPYRLRDQRNYDPARPDDTKLLVTPQYFQRTYKLVDARGADVPGQQAYFFISYYTGEPDVVPHVPERCYLGSGWMEVANVDRYVTVPDVKRPGATRRLPVRFVQFGKGKEVSTVAYLLCFNGQVASSHNEVRWKLNSPFGRHAYYSKIEMKFWNLHSLEGEIIPAVERLLGDFFPIYQSRFLADWDEYTKK